MVGRLAARLGFLRGASGGSVTMEFCLLIALAGVAVTGITMVLTRRLDEMFLAIASRLAGLT